MANNVQVKAIDGLSKKDKKTPVILGRDIFGNPVAIAGFPRVSTECKPPVALNRQYMLINPAHKMIKLVKFERRFKSAAEFYNNVENLATWYSPHIIQGVTRRID